MVKSKKSTKSLHPTIQHPRHHLNSLPPKNWTGTQGGLTLTGTKLPEFVRIFSFGYFSVMPQDIIMSMIRRLSIKMFCYKLW